MSDMLELSDADFALKMQGLVNEAKLAMEDRAAKAQAGDAPPPSEPPKPELKPAPAPPIQEHTCPNGLTVLVAEDHALPLVTIEIAAKNGSMTFSKSVLWHRAL